jgi:preprotein translocase SecE subunit
MEKYMKLGTFFKKTKQELTHVVWPSRSEAIAYSVLIIIIALISAYLLGLFDFIFTSGLEELI